MELGHTNQFFANPKTGTKANPEIRLHLPIALFRRQTFSQRAEAQTD
jgi:hypothetical protein